jgi:hypothetical protein
VEEDSHTLDREKISRMTDLSIMATKLELIRDHMFFMGVEPGHDGF